MFSELRNRKQVNKDMANVIKEYKGWFGKIFDSEEDFKEEWDELITSKKCQKWIDTLEFYTKYKDNIRATYQKYYEDNCPQQFRLVAIPDSISVDLTMPHDIVAAWISGEQDKSISIAKDFAMDFAESVLESAVDRMVSGGRRGGKSRGKNKSYSTPKKRVWT